MFILFVLLSLFSCSYNVDFVLHCELKQERQSKAECGSYVFRCSLLNILKPPSTQRTTGTRLFWVYYSI